MLCPSLGTFPSEFSVPSMRNWDPFTQNIHIHFKVCFQELCKSRHRWTTGIWSMSIPVRVVTRCKAFMCPGRPFYLCLSTSYDKQSHWAQGSIIDEIYLLPSLWCWAENLKTQFGIYITSLQATWSWPLLYTNKNMHITDMLKFL